MDQQQPVRCFIGSGCPIATTHQYRCLHLQEQLGTLGYEAHVSEWFQESAIDPAEPLGYDVIFLYRLSMSPPLRRVIDDAHAAGKPLIFDTDDLVFEPDFIDQHRAVQKLSPADQQQHAEGVRGYLATLQACDFTVTATPLLAEFARRRGKPGYVHRNALGQEMLAFAEQLHLRRERSPRVPDRVVIGYGSGTATHELDFHEAAGALLHVLERYDHAELWIAGPLQVPTAFERFAERVRRFPLTDWRGWFDLASQMDIALAPLEMGNLFCRAKSEIKFMEAGALRVPVIASDIDPFRDSITNGEDGLLAANEKEWRHALEILIQNEDQRTNLGERARRKVLQHYSPAIRADQLMSLMRQLAPSLPRPQVLSGKRDAVPTDSGFWRRAQSLLRRWKRPDTAPSAARLRINWLVPEPIPGAGGDLGIFRIVRDLADSGHDCQVYVLPYALMCDFSTEQIRAHILEHFGPTRAHYRRWNGHIDDADCSFATFWPTVENLTALVKGGRRYYLVQDFEPSFYEGDPHHILRAENTYRAGLHCITLGPWLARLLRERYDATADHFDFAVDTSIYWPRPTERRTNRRICFYARPATPRRGYELGLHGLELVTKRLPDVEVVLFGSAELNPVPRFPFVDRGTLTPNELAELFSSCDLGVVFSLSNPSFVPLEMMACRCPVVEIASERWEGVLTHAVDAWLVQPTAAAIADGIARLLEDQSLRNTIAENAYQKARVMDWRHSARQVEAVLLRDAGSDRVSS